MKWAIKERTEDAIGDYLRRTVPVTMKVYASWEDPRRIKYPCAIVFCGPGEPISEDAEFSIQRKFECAVVVVTELNLKDLLTSRDQHAFYFSEVMNALAISDLTAKVIESGTAEIAFSGVILEDEEEPVIESEGRRKRSTIGLTVYAEPVEGT